jgi:hypothetical protein
MDLDACGVLAPYDRGVLEELGRESLRSRLPLINALRHIQNTKITPEELLDSVFVRVEENQG